MVFSNIGFNGPAVMPPSLASRGRGYNAEIRGLGAVRTYG